MFGFNNNPNALQFRSAIKRLVCKQAVEASKAANVLDCESTSGVFKLEWRRSPIETSHSNEENELVFPLSNELDNISKPVQDNILYYIAGYIVRSLMGSVSCESCSEALIQAKRPKYNDHQYSNNFLEPHELLTTVKDRGGLLIPSASVFNTVKQCERTFMAAVILNPAADIANKALKLCLLATFRRQIIEEQPVSLFANGFCDIEVGMLSHQQQLINMIAEKFFDLRLKHYSRKYNSIIINNNLASDRNKFSRMVIFRYQ